METTRLNLVYDLLLKKTKLSSDISIDTLKPINRIYFVMCNSCYWYASYFGTDDLESLSGSPSHVLECPVCSSHYTELMPISIDESFRIEYSLTRGMEIEFYKSNNVVARRQCSDGYEAQRSPSE
jgi:hypothetical protein